MDAMPTPPVRRRRRLWFGERTIALLLTVLLAMVVISLILHDVERSLLYPAPPQTEAWGTEVLKRPDAVLRGWIVRPEAADAWVVFGGNGLALPPVGRAWQGCTERAIYLVPYRGYEGQEGRPGEKDMVEDGVALVRQAQQAHRHVGIIGVSLGTGVAIQVAVQARPDKLLLVTPYDRMDLVAQDYLPNWPVKWLISDRYDSANAAAKLGDLPVAFLQADHDEIIAAERTRALAAALPRPPSPWWHVDSTHNGIWEMPELCSFVRQGA